MITKTLQSYIESKFFKEKAIIITGARQVGKSTLLKQLIKKTEFPYLSLNCDEAEVPATLEDAGTERLKSIIGNNKIILIDGA